MARGALQFSLANLVDYLTQEEEDRAVPLSLLADAVAGGARKPISALADQLNLETPIDQTIRGLNDLRRQTGRGMMQLGEDIKGSRSMQPRGAMEEIATIPGHLMANTLQGAGYLTQFGQDDWENVKSIAGAAAEKAMDPKYIEGGWVRPAAEAVQPYVEEPYKIAQEMTMGDVAPGVGILAKLGMAAAPLARMGKVAKQGAVADISPKKGETMKLYHGSNSGSIDEISDKGLFGGVFAGDRGSAESHIITSGGVLHEIEIPEEKVLTQRALDYDLPFEEVQSALKRVANNNYLNVDDDTLDLLHSLIIEEKSVFDFSDEGEALKALDMASFEDLGDASWKAQRLRGEVAKELGYEAVDTSDEHGTSFLVLPGVSIKPIKTLDVDLQAVADIPPKKGEKMSVPTEADLFEIVNIPENRAYESYGLRVMTKLSDVFNDEYILEKFGKIPEEKPAKVGEMLPNSYEWNDGDVTDIELEGASVLSIDPNAKESISQALERLKKTYSIGNEQVVLVGGQDGGWGNDLGEKIVKNPIVLHAFNF